MRRHEGIDRRSLELARAVVAKIDSDPTRQGLKRAAAVCERWLAQSDGNPACREWRSVLAGSWRQVRSVLLDESEEGVRLRQSSPFCGVLTPRERWSVYRSCRDEA